MASRPIYLERHRLWGKKIGYVHSKKGDRVKKWFYFPGPSAKEPPDEVIADAVAKQREWEAIKTEWPELGPKLAELSPDFDWTLPVWYDPERYAWPLEDRETILDGRKFDAERHSAAAADDLLEVKETFGNLGAETIINQLRAAGVLPQSLTVPTRRITIKEAMAEYLANRKEQISKRIDSVKISTHNTSRNNLYLSLGLSTGKEPTSTGPLLDLNRQLISLTRADIQQVADHWFSAERTQTRRTIKNYFGGLKAFLKWCEEKEEYGFTQPKGTTKTLYISEGENQHVEAVDIDHLQAVLADAPERTKMYAMLALLCGFGQMDICKLEQNEVAMIKGETLITGYRAKEDSDAKSKSKIMTTHWVPEVLANMMRRHKAAPNSDGLFFLNRAGKPMAHEAVEGSSYDAVTKAWRPLREEKNAPTFKQLRKWGWNQIPLYGGVDPRCVGECLSHRWAGQTGGGIAKRYRFEDYFPVIDAQKKWWADIENKLIPALTVPAKKKLRRSLNVAK